MTGSAKKIRNRVGILLLFSALSFSGFPQVLTSLVDSSYMSGFFFREGNDQVIHHDFNKAVRSYQTALKYTTAPQSRSLIHQNLGCAYYLSGAYEKAVLYFTYACELMEPTGEFAAIRKAGLNLNIGSVWYEMKQPEKAIYWWNLAKKQTDPLSWTWQARVRMGMGNLFFQEGDFRKALTGYLDILNSMPPGTALSGEEVWIRKNIALCYGKLHIPDSAFMNLDRAIDRILNSSGASENDLPELFLIKGRLLGDLGNYSAALAMFDNGLKSIQSLEDTLKRVIECEQYKVRFFQLAKNGLDSSSARKYLDTLLPLIEKVEYRDLNGLTLELIFRAGMKDRNDLMKFIHTAELQMTKRIHAENQDIDRQQLEKQLFWFHKQRNYSGSLTGFPGIAQTKQEIRVWNEMDSLLKHRSQEAGNQTQEIDMVPGIEDKLKALNHQEALLEFIVTDSSLFAVLISIDSIAVVRNQIDSGLLTTMKSFAKALGTADEEMFYGSSYRLYDRLIAPFSSLIMKQKRLNIIPCQMFKLFPFDALIKKDSVPAEHPAGSRFLLQDVEISYSLSISSWYNGRMDTAISAIYENSDYIYDFFVCSPDFSQAVSHPKLDYAIREAGSLEALFSQRGHRTFSMMKSFPSEEDFLAYAGLSRIAHLASHSHKDQAYPEFAGWALSPTPSPALLPGEPDGRLEIGELQYFRMNTDLLVLSTCSVGETHLESWYRMTGFPENFLQAGVSNILFALWDISDKHTFQFMLDFYQGILNGESYAASLRKAKLKMLNCPETSSPTLWAPFVLYTR